MGDIAAPFVFVALMLVEFGWNAWRAPWFQDPRDSAVSALVAIPHFALLSIVPVVWVVLYRALWPHVPWHLPLAWWTWPLGIVVMDLAAYGMHRYHHALNLTWAVHAVQHVFEMQGRLHDGVEWLNATAPNWSDSALAFHNWWHLALHQLELNDIPAALGTYDSFVHPKPTTIALELIDASQLLARIQLRGGNVGARWSEPHDAGRFLAALPSIVESMRGCDLLLYQAGADPHIYDPLGGWLTTDEMRRRDAIVFDGARSLGIPIAWNLAGGYQRDLAGTLAPILEIHLNTAREWIRAFT